MAKGIVYLMSCSVNGVIKIGKTEDKKSYLTRMNFLENNGYYNVTGLKREFAIEVDNYAYKEKLLHRVLRNNRIADSELFSLNLEEAKQLLSALDGVIIYPDETVSKEEIFVEITDDLEEADPTKGDNEDEMKKCWYKFKETHFSSSLTQIKYYFKLNEKNTLGVYYEDTNEEIPNHSHPSKRQILKQAVKDLMKEDTPADIDTKTLYELARMLEKLVMK